MEEYYTKFKALVDELANYQSVPLYKCPCTCGSQRITLDVNDRDQVMRFLMGLNDSYSAIKGQILLYEPLLDINKVLFLILQEEKQRSFKMEIFLDLPWLIPLKPQHCTLMQALDQRAIMVERAIPRKKDQFVPIMVKLGI